MGFILTEAFTEEQTSGVRKRIVKQKKHRELSPREVECIQELLDTMKETSSDFTDTFRILGEVRTSLKCGCKNNLGDIASSIAQECAPIHVIEEKQSQSVYSEEEITKIETMLEHKPELISSFGIDEAELRGNIKKSR